MAGRAPLAGPDTKDLMPDVIIIAARAPLVYGGHPNYRATKIKIQMRFVV